MCMSVRVRVCECACVCAYVCEWVQVSSSSGNVLVGSVIVGINVVSINELKNASSRMRLGTK